MPARPRRPGLLKPQQRHSASIDHETDGLDRAGGSSREADKVSQLQARTNAYGERAREYMQCTVSTEQGRTWREIKAGTDSRIALPCPHCKAAGHGVGQRLVDPAAMAPPPPPAEPRTPSVPASWIYEYRDRW